MRYTLLFLLLFPFVSCFAQREVAFEYQRNARFLAVDGKEFVVYTHSGMSVADMYKKIVDNFNSSTVSRVEDEITTNADMDEIKVSFDKVSIAKLRGTEWCVDILFTIQLKEGRLRVLAPEISMFYKKNPIFPTIFDADGVGYEDRLPESMIKLLDSRDLFDKDDETYYEFNGNVTAWMYQLIDMGSNEADEDW